jgi:hypothetical protein
MPNLLVCSAAVVLQDVVLGCARREDEFLGDGLWAERNGECMSVFRGLVDVWVGRAYQNLGQVLVGDVG